jgi:hypothetical protein
MTLTPALPNSRTTVRQSVVVSLFIRKFRIDSLGWVGGMGCGWFSSATSQTNITFLGYMDDKGIGFVAVKNGLDTSSSSGRLMMKMISVFEEWNREILIERTKGSRLKLAV